MPSGRRTAQAIMRSPKFQAFATDEAKSWAQGYIRSLADYSKS